MIILDAFSGIAIFATQTLSLSLILAQFFYFYFFNFPAKKLKMKPAELAKFLKILKTEHLKLDMYLSKMRYGKTFALPISNRRHYHTYTSLGSVSAAFDIFYA